MADTFVIAQSITTAGVSFAVDSDGSSVIWPYSKIAFGAGGTQTEVSAGANALPVSVGNTIAAVVGGTVSITGSVPISFAAVGHVIVDSGQLGGVSSIGSIVSALPAGTNNIGTVGQSGTWNIAGVTSIGTLLGGTVAVGGVTSIGTLLGGTVTAVGTLLGGTVTAVGGVTSIGTVLGGTITSVGTLLGGTITAVGGVTSIGSIVSALPAGGNSIGMTQNIPGTAGGLSKNSITNAAGLNLALIKTGAGQLYFISVQTLNALPVYLKVFDLAGTVNVTMGTTTCDYQFMAPANATSSLGAGIAFPFDPGISHANGIVIAVTGGIGKADNTSLGASVALITVGYK